MSTDRARLVGNRLALVGAIIYLLEWAVIIPAGSTGPASLGTKPADIVSQYAGNTRWQELFASWFSVILLGRIAFAAGVRESFRATPRLLGIANFAVGAMAVSVVLEIASYAVAAAAGWSAHHGGETSTIVALDGGANWLNDVIFGPIGVSVAVMSFAMLRSRLFPTWLCWLGLVAGKIGTVAGALSGPGFAEPGTGRDLWHAASVFVPGFWIWMLATGVILWRRAPRASASASA